MTNYKSKIMYYSITHFKLEDLHLQDTFVTFSPMPNSLKHFKYIKYQIFQMILKHNTKLLILWVHLTFSDCKPSYN